MASNMTKSRVRTSVLTGAIALAILLLARSSHAADPDGLTRYRQQVLPLLKSYCYGCHGDGAKEGNLTLDQFAADGDVLQNRELWWKVLKNVRAGLMPPAGEDRPQPEEMKRLADWIKFDVFQIQPENVDPGRFTVRRLNRREYGNTINDLMGINFDATILFPPDDSGYGFDNVGDALSFSPLLMEKYLRAAQMIVDQAVPKVTWITPRQEIPGRDFRDNDVAVQGDNMSSKKAA
jgi:mono/diheme cytochrome c family protein